MASSNKKWSQEELRKLMKEKVQSKKDTRVDSPLAKYDDQNNLWCVVCNQIISSDFLWTTHLIGKAHKKRIEELKQKKQALSNAETSSTNNTVSNPLKRSLKSVESIPNKISKLDIDYPKKDFKKIEEKESKQNVQQSNKNIVDETSLPQDFFDDGIKPEFLDNNKKEDNVTTDEEQNTKNLPKGFFDDPKLDAKARKATHVESIDAQFELFRKEIAEETLISESIAEEDATGLEKEKTLIEIDEQIQNWSKVDRIQKKIEEIHKKKQQQQQLIDDNMNNTDESDSDDQIDLNNMNFWRKKDVFL